MPSDGCTTESVAGVRCRHIRRFACERLRGALVAIKFVRVVRDRAMRVPAR